ncbi:DNA mismatch repair endonuclease MutL [Humisphaera borealis]|uniref:DNA mismatch repair protein MutL n=1 Tax=Humisphaera borealis TaxID=2807512 RepID=A0A7M2X3A4_9BACT|nr:DNA mismatch repair endonuclease MutL [Humisphaera borealis]QOV91501.1 DNA mismatch repair endonuclease MutL [Humisphaera borealis]
MERRPIQQLSPGLINRIAAGEVIERPANVVKELVENAVDAGATQITIDVEDGGRALIRVIDNGGGIPPAELPLAFASHATSKLSSDEDLFRIMTMGFRGEALASIGSVSHSRILSRTAADDSAWEIHNRGGEITFPQAAAGNVGTCIEVRNLFFNTPARRKFIKGTSTEFGHIADMVTRLSLPQPHIAFKLTHNGRVTADLPAVASPVERWLTAWPSEFRDQKLDINCRDAELRIRGVVGLPELGRPTPKYQFVYLNGRHIRDKTIMHALREAFRGLMEPGRHPAAILMLDVPPGDVDVNVHPTKIEVRFRDSGRIYSLVLSGVREKVLASDLTPTAIPMKSDVDVARESQERLGVRQQLADYFKQQFSPAGVTPGVPQPMLPVGDPLGARVSSPAFGFGEPLARYAPSAAAIESPRAVGATMLSPGTESSSVPNAAPFVNESAEDARISRVPFALPSTTTVPPRAELPKASAIQLHNSYLVVQSDEGMLIIDQHALHERIMYEELLARVSRGPMESQRMLIPQVIDVSSSQAALLEQIQPVLQRMGIDVTAFGPQSVAVQAFPTFLDRLEPATFVRELLERGEQELLDMHQEELMHEVLDMMACKAAVKAGDPLTPQEIEALLARRDLVDRSSNCPHGRPTTLRLTLRDLEKQFKRTGF